MEPFRVRSTGEQVTEYLRGQMLRGDFGGTMPGIKQLVGTLGVNSRAVEAAMRQLATEGLLVSQGTGKRRRIVLPEGDPLPRHFRVRMIAFESMDRNVPHVIDLLDRLNKNGFTAKLAAKSLLDLGMDAKRISRFVRDVPADAWIVAAGSREVLGWFCRQPAPAYAYFGVKSGLPIAGCGVQKDIQLITRHLVQLGHRRIVLLNRSEHVSPKRSVFAQLFLDSLQAEGIAPGPYHLPKWGYHPEGLHHCLDSLFKVTRPTALIAGEASILIAVRDHLARCGIIAPRDVSLISLDQDPSFVWCDPLTSHFAWDFAPINRSVVRWAKNVARGKIDQRQITISARFVEGGTIGPRRRRAVVTRPCRWTGPVPPPDA